MRLIDVQQVLAGACEHAGRIRQEHASARDLSSASPAFAARLLAKNPACGGAPGENSWGSAKKGTCRIADATLRFDCNVLILPASHAFSLPSAPSPGKRSPSA